MRVISRTASRLRHEEDGIALVLAIVAMAVLATTTTALLLDGAANQRGSSHSQQAKQAFQLAETGVAYAEGITYQAVAAGTSPPIGAQTLPAQPSGGSGRYWTSVGPDGQTWTMVGEGTVGGVTKTVRVQASVPSPQTITDSAVWNYLYADASGAGCDTTVNGSVTISVPIVVRGNLCLGGSLNYRGSQLEVGGNLTVSGSATVGTSSAKVATLEIAGSPSSTACSNDGTTATPGTGVCNGSTGAIQATTVGTTLGLSPEMPNVDFQAMYDAQAALTQSGCPSGLFDNDSTLNNSGGDLSAKVFSSSAYDCFVGSNELKWTPPPHNGTGQLTVHGTFYFDGSLTLSGDTVYSGQASLYVTGGVTAGNNSTFCGIVGCTTAWDPDVNGIIFVAACWAPTSTDGSALISSGCINLSGGATVQFGAYVTTDYTTAGGSSNMGPVLANTLNLGGSSQTLIPFHDFPANTPLNSRTTHLPASSPTSWAG